MGQAPVRTSVPLPTMLTPCEIVSDKEGELPLCSAWVFVDVPLPPGAGEVGLALRSGSAAKGCAAPSYGGAASARVLVSSVSVVEAASKN